MKCVKRMIDEKIIRVKNEKAEELVSSGKYSYCPKSEWKNQGR